MEWGSDERMERREKTVITVPHQLILQDRKRLELSGVIDVENFDETTVNCRTSLGRLTVCGKDLHVQRLDLDGTALSVEGTIDALTYTDVKKGGLLGRLFR
jgi:sporulation protein YabP